MIHVANLPPQQILFLKKLYIGLGYNNIKNIYHCMSRIRIQINDPNLLSTDSYFLNLGAQGVSRDINSIQLIYGKQSALIANQLSSLYKSLEDVFLLDLLYLFQGSSNISDITSINSIIYLSIKKIPDNLPILIQQFSEKYNIMITIDNHNIQIHLDNICTIEDFMISYYTIILYWDLIQNIIFFNYIDINNIQAISRDNFNLNITTLEYFSMPNPSIINCGLDISNSSVCQNNLIIHNCSDNFINSFEYYYQLKKNTISDIDNI